MCLCFPHNSKNCSDFKIVDDVQENISKNFRIALKSRRFHVLLNISALLVYQQQVLNRVAIRRRAATRGSKFNSTQRLKKNSRQDNASIVLVFLCLPGGPAQYRPAAV